MAQMVTFYWQELKKPTAFNDFKWFCRALSADCNVGVFSHRNDNIKIFKYLDFLQKFFGQFYYKTTTYSFYRTWI